MSSSSISIMSLQLLYESLLTISGFLEVLLNRVCVCNFDLSKCCEFVSNGRSRSVIPSVELITGERSDHNGGQIKRSAILLGFAITLSSLAAFKDASKAALKDSILNKFYRHKTE